VKSSFNNKIVYFRCPHKHNNDVDCATGDSKINQECHCKSDCRIEVNNGVFGDPCHDTYKYLKITYICVSDDGK